MFIVQCLIVAILAGLLRWDGRVFGQCLTETPLCAGLLVGIVLGDPYTGLIMGGATPPDSTVGAVMGTFYAIQTGMDAEAVIALAMPISILGQFLGILSRVINARFNGVIDEAAAAGNTKKIDHALWGGAWVFFILTAVPVFAGCYWGADAVEAVVNALPTVIIDGLSRSSSLLPALGMALLMNFLFDKNYAPYLFLGFALNAFLGLSTLGCTFIGAVIAVVIYNNSRRELA